LYSLNLPDSYFAFDFTPVSDGVYFVLSAGSTRFIAFWPINEDQLYGVEIDGLSSLSAGPDSSLIFSSNGKIGKMEDNKIQYSDTTVSGGVDYPVYDSNFFYYISHQYKFDKIVKADISEFTFNTTEEFILKKIQFKETISPAVISEIFPYKPFSFFNKWSVMIITGINEETGIGAVFEDPAERYMLTVGTTVQEKQFALQFDFTDKSAGDFRWSETYDIFLNHSSGNTSFINQISAEYTHQFDNLVSFTSSFSSTYFNYKREDWDSNHNFINTFSVSLGKFSRSYPGYWGTNSISAGVTTNVHDSFETLFENVGHKQLIETSFALAVLISGLLPIEPDGYNNFCIPVTLFAKYSPYYNYIYFKVTPVIYSREIQRGSYFTGLFLQRINIKIINETLFDIVQSDNTNDTGAVLNLQLCPLLGRLGKTIPLSLDFIYWIYGSDKGKVTIAFNNTVLF